MLTPLTFAIIATTAVALTFPADRSAPEASICAGASDSAQMFVAVAPPAGRDTTSTMTVCLVQSATRTTGKVAGFYGEIVFTPGVRVLKVDRPLHGMRVDNATNPGRVSFAGAATDGFPTGPLLTVVFVSNRGIIPRVLLHLYQINDVAGRSLTGTVRVDSLARVHTAPRR